MQCSGRACSSLGSPYAAFGVHAGSEAVDPRGRIWRCLASLLFLSMLWWSEMYGRRGGDAEISLDKAAFCRSSGHIGSIGAPVASRRGGELAGALLPPDFWKPNLHLEGVGILPRMLEASTFGVPKRPLQCIAAMNGLWRHSLLGCYASPSVFLQDLRRIFIDLDKGSMAAVVPSGMFPGDGGGNLVGRSRMRGGEERGLDLVSGFVPRVCLAIGLSLSCIPLSFRGLVAKLLPPLG
jgi:hypothetical protein